MPRSATLERPEGVGNIALAMTLDAEKSATLKGSVIFVAPEPEEGAERPALSKVYIQRTAWAALGEPSTIVLSVATTG